MQFSVSEHLEKDNWWLSKLFLILIWLLIIKDALGLIVPTIETGLMRIQQTLIELDHVPGILPRGFFCFIFKTTQQKVDIFSTILQTSNQTQKCLEI